MKRKRTHACHHRNEWVVVHSLGEACFIGPIAVRAWAWCRQWRSDQSPWRWATSSGMVSSGSKPHAHRDLSSLHALYTVLLHEFAACNPHHSFIHSFIHSLGVRHRSRPWAVFLWRQEESGLHPLLQIQEKAVVQATPFHHIQWEYTITDTGPMGNGGRVCGSRSTCWRGGGAEAVRGGEGFNEGGVWGRSPGGWTTDRAWQRGVYSALTLNFLAFPVRCKRYYWVRAVLKWFDLKSCDWTSSKQVKDKTQSVLWTWRTCLCCN